MKKLVGFMLFAASISSVSAALVSADCAREPQGEDLSTRARELNQQGHQLYVAADYAKAETTLSEALQILQGQDNPDRDLLAGTYFNLAAVERMRSRFDVAEPLYKRAIETRETAPALAGLALLYLSQDRADAARQSAERAVQVAGDLRHQAVAKNTLATILLARGDLAAAASLETQVIDQLRGASATASNEFVDALVNLATVRANQSNYREAEAHLHEAETVALKIVGPNHPLTASIWNNLAYVLAQQGDTESAEAPLRKAIMVWRKSLGQQHPDLAHSLTNLAAIYKMRKQYGEAERAYQQALKIDETAFGAASVRVANDLNNLGALSAARHRFDEAEARLSKALSIAEARAGSQNKDAAGIAVNLAIVYFEQAKYRQASVLFARALPVKQRLLGSDSPEVAQITRLYTSSLAATRVDARNALVAKR